MVHGFMSPATAAPAALPSLGERWRQARTQYGWFFVVVLLPCLAAALYLYGFAADQYESEAHYLVRAQGAPASSGSSMEKLLGASGSGSGGGGQGEANSVADFLLSHDAVDALSKQSALIARFRRPEADGLSRLPTADPTPEALLKYYRKQVDVHFDTDTGITTLKVRAFRPVDAYVIARKLLGLGEGQVNTMNVRSYADAVKLSHQQLAESEAALSQVQARMTDFRQDSRDVNPQGTAEAQIGLVSKLQAELSAARSQLATTVSLIGTRNPQYAALSQQVRSLQSQVAAQSAKLAGGGNAIAAGLGDYERLRMQQGFLSKRYDAASAAFEAARQQAVRQQLYIVRIVDANMPVRSEYPKRALSLLTLFIALMVVYGLGWLVAAGVREHAS
ncbi:capsular polysaccharide transport system permease protein [Sphingomonas sp. PP-F2F-A104-K0414]|uniref:lipopolysaccharide biosynthesis protein n=1 Tax=Sphingomonas sp. PP-F2F-A104-K0414 TaxID=2135661 RepID=UPI0010E32F89|nr:lipopolysaccharide biosynthesis protein [Sphingomonas sp. PP-F2F-A104-K0414]TCQ00185.1 capsular polysaccharide transport system permease protein [Sphingomonas sp. PP-F2F-A104-K0414]